MVSWLAWTVPKAILFGLLKLTKSSAGFVIFRSLHLYKSIVIPTIV
jgi:hypothetical protein